MAPCQDAATVGAMEPLPVEIIRSVRRRKSCQARIVDGVIEVRVPAGLAADDERSHVADLIARLQRSRSAGRVDLTARARALASRYDLPVPASVRWVGNQRQRWGSCSMGPGATGGDIRLSDRMGTFPIWVIDAVLLHEMAHQVEMDHGPRFGAIVERYPRDERATGFLIAKAHDEGLDPCHPA